MRHHLILDLDGTLIDSSPAILDSLGAALRARGLSPILPLSRDLIGPPLHATLQALSGVTDRAELEAMAAEFRSRYDTEGLYATQAFPGVHDMLQAQVAAGRSLHLATNKRERPTLLLLEHFGWRSLFASVYCIDSRTPPYPSKGEMLRVQLREQGLAAAECLYVGDTRHDQQAAAQAGLRFVGVGWGYGVGEQAFTGEPQVVKHPRDLLGL